jgi:hypothetical protein
MFLHDLASEMLHVHEAAWYVYCRPLSTDARVAKRELIVKNLYYYVQTETDLSF